MGPVAAGMGVLMALSPLLQARRIRLAGDASEVSSGVFLVMRTNASVWLLYGLASANAVIVVPNVFGIATTTFTLYVIRRHRRSAGSPVPPPGLFGPAERPEQAELPERQLDRHVARVRGGAASVARAGRRLAHVRR